MTLSSDGRANAESMVDRIHRMEKRWVSDDGETPNEQALWDMIEDCNRVFRYLLRNEKQPMTEEEKIIQQLTNLSSAAIHTGNAIEAIQTLMESHGTRIHALEKAYTKLYMGLEKLIEPTEDEN